MRPYLGGRITRKHRPSVCPSVLCPPLSQKRVTIQRTNLEEIATSGVTLLTELCWRRAAYRVGGRGRTYLL